MKGVGLLDIGIRSFAPIVQIGGRQNIPTTTFVQSVVRRSRSEPNGGMPGSVTVVIRPPSAKPFTENVRKNRA